MAEIPEKPFTRKEQYLATIAGVGVGIPDKPLTREEQYFAKISGASTNVPEKPLTRVERYLAYIAQEGVTGGGGGGNSLSIYITAPSGSTVTAEKDGDVYSAAERSGTWEIPVPEYGIYTVKATLGNESATIEVEVKKPEGIIKYTNVFGVMWDYSNPSTALTRLRPTTDPKGWVNTTVETEPVAAVGTGEGSSPFDNYYPWRDIEQYNIDNNAVSFKRREDGFSQTLYDTVVYIPEFYYAVVDDSSGQKRYWYISNKPHDGFEKHPGSGRYVGRYNTGANYVSKSNLAPLVNIKRSDARTGSHAKGDNWYQYDYATWCAVWLLYLVEYADWDSQKKIGRGYVDGNSYAINSGSTDAMIYHTGRAAGVDGKTAVQYRWIENPWGNVWEWIDGINFSDYAAWISLDNANFKDDTTSGYTYTGVTLPTSNYIKFLRYSSICPWGFLSNESGGSETTYIPDYVYSNAGWRVLSVGGDYGNASNAGLFCFSGSNASSNTHKLVGARLQYNP